MPYICCVRIPHTISQPLFSVPKDEIRKKLWEESLGMALKKSHHICATHFNECDVIDTWTSGSGASKYTVSQWCQISFEKIWSIARQWRIIS